VEERNGRLEVGKGEGDFDWVQSGLITKKFYDLKRAKISVEIAELDSQQPLNLQISMTKAANNKDPWQEKDWYVLVKMPAVPDPIWTVERKIGGVVGGMAFGVFEEPTGELMIETRDGWILFYENGKLKYGERYAFPSYNCCIDIRHSTLTSEAKKSAFKNFTLITGNDLST
jgi:hypothetical protein